MVIYLGFRIPHMLNLQRVTKFSSISHLQRSVPYRKLVAALGSACNEWKMPSPNHKQDLRDLRVKVLPSWALNIEKKGWYSFPPIKITQMHIFIFAGLTNINSFRRKKLNLSKILLKRWKKIDVLFLKCKLIPHSKREKL